jgi:hypothetical protein
MMFEKQYKKEMKQIAPSQQLINIAKSAMLIEMQSETKEKSTHLLFPKVTVLAVLAFLLFALFGVNHLNRTDELFNGTFAMTTYVMEQQLDGTYVWKEVDITQLHGFGMYYDGEVLYIGLGLWFEFEDENIETIEFSLKDGFFATQYIGNRSQRSLEENVSSSHVGIPPDFTTYQLVRYGTEFEEIGDTITFGSAMPDDILLFWGSYDIGYDDWWMANDKIIEIDVTITLEDGNIRNQSIVLDYSDRQGASWSIEPGVFPLIDIGLDALTDEQYIFILETAEIEQFTLVPDALTELELVDDLPEGVFQFTHEFDIGEHDPIGFSVESTLYYEMTRIPIGARDGNGYAVIITFDDNDEPIVNAYSIPLN